MVVAEKDVEERMATVKVACPNCGDMQAIDADRMISITVENADDQLSSRASNQG